MADGKVIAGHAVRRARRQTGLTQAAMAEVLGISASYLNLVERNQRPVSAQLLIRLAERFDFDPRALAAAEPGGGAAAMRRRLADPLFADIGVDRGEVEAWLAAAPGGAEAFARAFDRQARAQPLYPDESDPAAAARQAIETWNNHFADLDAHAESIADELRMGSGELGPALAERLRARHAIAIRVMPVDVLPGITWRMDLHARQLQLSELLDPAARTFAAAVALAQIEARGEIDALARGAALASGPSGHTADRLFRRHLASYWAAALMMPYARFLRACEATGYDIHILQRRFGAGFEQVAHRLTTLGRVGARGLPFFMIRIDRAGQVSKRFTGTSGAALAEADGRCPLWRLHHATDRPGVLAVQLVELEEGDSPPTRWLTLARSVSSQERVVGGVPVEFIVGLGVDARLAGVLAAARGIELTGPATPIGLGCRACLRSDCPQRSAPPRGRAMIVSERERGVTGWEFAGD